MDYGGAGEANICNGHKNPEDEEFDKREDEEEEKEEEDGETNALLTPVINGGLAEKRQKSSRRRVQWNELVEVMEFEPSDASDSEEDSSKRVSDWDQAIVDCIRFCCCLGNRRSRS